MPFLLELKLRNIDKNSKRWNVQKIIYLYTGTDLVILNRSTFDFSFAPHFYNFSFRTQQFKRGYEWICSSFCSHPYVFSIGRNHTNRCHTSNTLKLFQKPICQKEAVVCDKYNLSNLQSLQKVIGQLTWRRYCIYLYSLHLCRGMCIYIIVCITASTV